MVSRVYGGGAKFIIKRHDGTFLRALKISVMTFVELHDYICFQNLQNYILKLGEFYYM